MIRLFLSKTSLVAFLALMLHTPSGVEKPFMGLQLGMPAREALKLTGRAPDVLTQVRVRDGKRIITDTVPLTFCKLPMRRSLGFDSLGTLTAIGITYKTTPDKIKSARDCAFQWLTSMFGSSDEEQIHDNTKQEIWHLGAAQLTMEAKGYNENDYFVLIYYYKPNERP